MAYRRLHNVLLRTRVQISCVRSGLALALGFKRGLDLSDSATKPGFRSDVTLFAFPERLGLVEVVPESCELLNKGLQNHK